MAGFRERIHKQLLDWAKDDEDQDVQDNLTVVQKTVSKVLDILEVEDVCLPITKLSRKLSIYINDMIDLESRIVELEDRLDKLESPDLATEAEKEDKT